MENMRYTDNDRLKQNTGNALKNRIVIVFAAFIVIVIMGTFLNTRVDDEREYTYDDYISIPDTIDDSDGIVTVHEDSGLIAGDTIAEIPEMHVDAGEFTIDVEHQNEYDLEAVIYDGEVELERFVLPAAELNTSHAFSSDESLYRLRIAFLYNGSGVAVIKRSILHSKGLFYTDTVFYALMLVIGGLLMVYIILRYDILALPLRDKLFWGILVLFLIWINYPFYRPMILAHDIMSHMSRIEGMMDEIKHGQFPVMMYTDGLGGKGTVAILYPNLFLYIPVLLRIIKVSPDGAIRAAYMIINYTTCGTAFYAGKRLFNDRYKALCFMILYVLLPYRTLTMTWRWAYGEALAMIFIPLVVVGWYEILLGDKRKWMILTIGISGILQSHILAFVFTLAVCLVIGVCFIDRLIKERRLISLILAAATSIFFNLWFIGPFVYYYFSDVDYYLQMVRPQFTEDLYHASRIFQVSKEASFVAGAGLLLLVAVAIWIHISDSYRNRYMRFSLVCIIAGIMLTLMELKSFPWMSLQKIEGISRIIGMIQFPFRFSLIGQTFLLIGSIMTLFVVQRSEKMMKIIMMIATILIFIQSYNTVQSYLEANPDEGIDWETARFEPNTYGYISYDYIPTDYDEEGFPDTVVGSGANVSDFWHDHMNSGFSYASDRDAYVDIPLFYYKGYRAYDEDGKELEIIKGDSANMRIELPDSRGTVKSVKIVYNMTLWHIFFLISMASVVALTVVLHITKKKTRSDYIGFAK